MRTSCPGCGEIYDNVPDEWAGQVARCEHCGKEFTVNMLSEAQELWQDVLKNHSHLVDFLLKIRPLLNRDTQNMLFDLWRDSFFNNKGFAEFDFYVSLFHGLGFSYDLLNKNEKNAFYLICIKNINSIIRDNIAAPSRIALKVAPIAAALSLDLATQTQFIINAIEENHSGLSPQTVIALLDLCEDFIPANRKDKKIYAHALLLRRKAEQSIIITAIADGNIPSTSYNNASLPVMLAGDELPIWCWLNATVEARETKMVRQSTPRHTSYGGGSIRLGKGISIHGGSISGNSVPPKYEETDIRLGFGDFIITNKNLFFIFEDGRSIKMPIKKITSVMEMSSNAIAITQGGAKMAKPISFTFYADDSFNNDDTAAWFIKEVVQALYEKQ